MVFELMAEAGRSPAYLLPLVWFATHTRDQALPGSRTVSSSFSAGRPLSGRGRDGGLVAASPLPIMPVLDRSGRGAGGLVAARPLPIIGDGAASPDATLRSARDTEMPDAAARAARPRSPADG